MSQAIISTVSLSITTGKYIFRASGSNIEFDGYLKIYNTEDSKDKKLPKLVIGEDLKIESLKPNQHFTQPPPRYTEATLVKLLEDLGIGRPSTYAPTINTILKRYYVVLEKRAFAPTELGVLVTELLEEYFKDILNKEFTAKMEERLDEVEEGKEDWKQLIANFYEGFEKELKVAEEEMKNIEIKDEVTDVICEKCGRNMVIKMGKYGKFLACPGFPECSNAKPLVVDLGIDCPKCDGKVVERRSKKGRVFYGCSNYPECDFVSWDKPTKEKCPKCNTFMVEKRNKGTQKEVCTNPECGFEKELSEEK